MKHPRPRILAGLIAALLVPQIVSAQTVISAGTNAGAFNATSPSPTAYILNAGDTRSQNGSTDGVSFGTAGTAGTYTLTINGSLVQTGTGRAVRTANVSAAGGHTFNLNVGATGLIRATTDDAVQGRFQGSGSFVFNVNNLGTIYSGPDLSVTPTTVLATGQALDLASAIGGTVNNGSITNTTALLRADGHDAVRLGSNMTMNNYGIVLGNSVVNDSSNNNGFNAAPNNSTAENFSTAEGVSFETANNSTLNNYGSITGARHGVESAETATNITINNFAGGVIVGRNGSGIGFDATSASATNVIIVNNGEIRGDYAGVGHIVDRTGNPSFTNDGDGDGIDIDGAVTITNNGLIHSTGAGGFDSGGRANSAEGIAIGGGVVVNNATGIIRGANRGILVNNDANLDRSAVAAASVTNAGLIEGQNGFAIRFEGNFADTITNTGMIIGTGSIPDPSGTVLRQDGLVDPANGMLDGVTYGPGSSRFIRGDGSAIQMGEGNDTLNNSGTITGTNGRAINLEGGNDTLNITGGSAVVNGDINGGAGTNTMNLMLGVGNSFSYSGSISNFSTVHAQSGTTTLSGVSTYTGKTRVTGNLVLQGANRINSASALELSGGYLKISSAGANGQTFASLTLEDNSIIDLDNNSSLTFNGLDTHVAGKTLSIVNYDEGDSPDYAIRFLGDFTADAEFLALIGATTIDGGAAEYFYDGQYTNVGLNFAPIPEPSTIGFGLVLLGLAGVRQRRAKVVAA